jgi:hypothetical protein
LARPQYFFQYFPANRIAGTAAFLSFPLSAFAVLLYSIEPGGISFAEILPYGYLYDDSHFFGP